MRSTAQQTQNHLDNLLRRVQIRLYARIVLRQMLIGLTMMAAVWLLLAVTRNLIVFDRSMFAIIAAVVVGVHSFVSIWNTCRQYSDASKIAQLIDQNRGLQNRLTAAVEIQGPEYSSIDQLVVLDAFQAAKGILPAEIVTLPNRRSAIAAIAGFFVAAAGLAVSPWWVAPVAAEQRPVSDVVASDQLSKLESQLQQILDELESLASKRPDDELKEITEATQTVLDRIKEQKLSTSEALLELSKLQQKMQDVSSRLDPMKQEPAWQKVTDALLSSQATADIGKSLEDGQFQQAADQMKSLASDQLDAQQFTDAERTSVSEKLSEAADASRDVGNDDLAEVLQDLSESIAEGNGEAADQQMQDLSDEATKFQFDLDQTEHLDELADQVMLSKQNLSVKSNSSGDGQMGGQGLNEETGQSNSKGGADSQKAGAKTAGNIDGPKAKLDGQKKLAELQGQFGEEGESQTKKKSTDEAPEFEITRKAQAIHAEYSRQRETDLQRQSLPAGHEEIVRKYFESIRPEVPGSSDR